MPHIYLLPHTPAHLHALLEGEDTYEARFHCKVAEGLRDFVVGPEVSPDFLARLEGPAEANPWRDGFAVVRVEDKLVIGLCSFTGEPTADGEVEIAYGIAPSYQGKGYATEAARALVSYARDSGRVRTICAHTLPQKNASTRVLEKCGFNFKGEVTHPEDGLIWRWERAIEESGN